MSLREPSRLGLGNPASCRKHRSGRRTGRRLMPAGENRHCDDQPHHWSGTTRLGLTPGVSRALMEYPPGEPDRSRG